MLVVLEGIDTAGKSTQIALLKEHYPQGFFTKEPGGTPLGTTIRSLVLDEEQNLGTQTELLLFLADRAEHYDKVIKPNSDKLIISDRGVISGIAYANNELDKEFIIAMNRFALCNTLPDKVILLKLSSEELTHRLSQKSHDGIEKRGIDYLLKIQNNMETALQILNIPHCIIDASLTPQTIFTTIQRFIDG